jgi:hypothetical protein
MDRHDPDRDRSLSIRYHDLHRRQSGRTDDRPGHGRQAAGYSDRTDRPDIAGMLIGKKVGQSGQQRGIRLRHLLQGQRDRIGKPDVSLKRCKLGIIKAHVLLVQHEAARWSRPDHRQYHRRTRHHGKENCPEGCDTHAQHRSGNRQDQHCGNCMAPADRKGIPIGCSQPRKPESAARIASVSPVPTRNGQTLISSSSSSSSLIDATTNSLCRPGRVVPVNGPGSGP